jgi:hypothetical protein
MLTRKASFVCIPMSVTDSDVKRIKISRSFFQIIFHTLYYFIFRKFIKYRKQIFEDFILYDNGMQINKSFIPYEYLIAFSDKTMLLLAKNEDEKIIPSDSFLKLEFKHNINSNAIKNNLYYHLKYNTIDMDMFQFKSVKFNFQL